MHPDRDSFTLIGLYFVHWSSFELAVSIGAAKIEKLSFTDAVKKMDGWGVANKVRHLKKLIEQSDHPEKIEILKILSDLPNLSLRNSIAHSFMRFGNGRIVFIHRNKKGKVRRYEFTVSELHDHLRIVSGLANQLTNYLNKTHEEAEAVAEQYLAAVQQPNQ